MSFSPVCLFHQDQQVPHKSHSVVAKLFRARAAPGPCSPRTSASHWRLRRFCADEGIRISRCRALRALCTGIGNWSSPSQSASSPSRSPVSYTKLLAHGRLVPRASRPPHERPLAQEASTCVFGSRAPGKTHNRFVAQKKRNRQSKRVCSDGRPGCASSATIRSTDTVSPSCSLACSCSKRAQATSSSSSPADASISSSALSSATTAPRGGGRGIGIL